MARNFLAVSPSYADRVSEKIRRLDAAVVAYLDDSYRLSKGQATRVRAALKKVGHTLTKAELEAVIRRFRIPFLMLNKKATRSMRATAQKGHAPAEGWACLVADGLTTWDKVERRLAVVRPAGRGAAGKSEMLFVGTDVVLLTRARYDLLLHAEKVVLRVAEAMTSLRS